VGHPRPFATPDSLAANAAITVYIPQDETGLAALMYCLSLLACPENWFEAGTLTPEECADQFMEGYIDFINDL